MNSVYDTLAHQIINKLEESNKYRILVFISGNPGSGKSTLAQKVKERINKIYHENETSSKTSKVKSNINTNPHLRKSSISSTNVSIFPGSHGSMETSIKVISSPNDILPQSTNEKDGDDCSFVQTIPMDGFHLPRYVLDSLPDSKMLHERRGAPFTFDDTQVVKLSQILNSTCINNTFNLSNTFNILPSSKTRIPTIYLPSFDHSQKDPKADDIIVLPSTRIVIIEGLYMLLSTDEWKDVYLSCYEPTNDYQQVQILSTPSDLDLKSQYIKDFNDNEKLIESNKVNYKSSTTLSISINISEETGLKRVTKRHLQTGLCDSIDEATNRFNSNDLLNGRLVNEYSFVSDIVINSVEAL